MPSVIIGSNWWLFVALSLLERNVRARNISKSILNEKPENYDVIFVISVIA